MKTSRDQTIQQMVEALGKKKYSFLSSLESDITSYIARQSPSQCMTLVSRCSDGSVMNRWYPKEINGLKCLYHDYLHDNHNFMYEESYPGCKPLSSTRCKRCGYTMSLHKVQK